GLRAFNDNIIPEVVGLVVTGVVFAYLRPRRAVLWLAGIRNSIRSRSPPGWTYATTQHMASRRMVSISSRIAWIQAEGDYARVHAGGKSYLVARSLTDLERRLDPDRFPRIHRSAIVNRDHIREVAPEGSSRY